jgi:hypothetical protein
MFKNNLTLGYILLVGVPLLILVGTLRAGGSLVAPSAVSGEWTVERTGGNCAAPLGNTLSVQQVGTDLLISFGDPRKTTLAGTLEGGHISAAGHAFRMEATISGKPDHRSWQGQVSVDGSDSCAPVQFRATKSGK